jgi:hypothetical protein
MVGVVRTEREVLAREAKRAKNSKKEHIFALFASPKPLPVRLR